MADPLEPVAQRVTYAYLFKNEKGTNRIYRYGLGVLMASQAQIEANRQNAKKSTGPKSESGKSVAKLNAVKHGLTAEHVVVPAEDSAEFEELRRDLEQELEPVGRQESEIVETIAMCMWRRR